LLGIFFDPEDGGEMFHRNVSWLSTDYMAFNVESFTLHNHRSENLKSHIALVHTDFAMKPSRGECPSDTQYNSNVSETCLLPSSGTCFIIGILLNIGAAE
jgi:hypothetical protein